MIFCGNVADVDAAEAIRLNVIVTQSERVAHDFACFEPENPKYSLRNSGGPSSSPLASFHPLALSHHFVYATP